MAGDPVPLGQYVHPSEFDFWAVIEKLNQLGIDCQKNPITVPNLSEQLWDLGEDVLALKQRGEAERKAGDVRLRRLRALAETFRERAAHASVEGAAWAFRVAADELEGTLAALTRPEASTE